jgi:hypothetical protein
VRGLAWFVLLCLPANAGARLGDRLARLSLASGNVLDRESAEAA